MAQPSLPRPSRRSFVGCRIKSVRFMSSPRWSKRCWVLWRARKSLAAKQPTLPKGRPSTQVAKAAARKKKRLAQQRAALFASRYLFVQRHLNKTERKTLWRVSRGLPQLQALRAIMEQVYALFDRRCRTQTALAKLATLRRRVQRFKVLGDTLKKLFSPTLEKALTFLDRIGKCIFPIPKA